MVVVVVVGVGVGQTQELKVEGKGEMPTALPDSRAQVFKGFRRMLRLESLK